MVSNDDNGSYNNQKLMNSCQGKMNSVIIKLGGFKTNIFEKFVSSYKLG